MRELARRRVMKHALNPLPYVLRFMCHSRKRAPGSKRTINSGASPPCSTFSSPSIRSTYTMAMFFSKVPREIRDQIYHLVLVDEASAIELSYAGSCRSLHAAILQTCRQAYEEAMPMLYEKNSFLFRTSAHSSSCLGAYVDGWQGFSESLNGAMNKIECVSLLYYLPLCSTKS